MSATAVVPYNFALSAASASWIYAPSREATADVGWNASYTGNTTWPFWTVDSDEGDGALYFRTRAQGASVALDFTGTALTLCVLDVGATHEFAVDGELVNATGAAGDPTCAAYSGTSALVAQVAFGAHHVEVKVTSSPLGGEFWFFGGVVTADIEVGNGESEVTEVRVDDRASDWVFTPGRGSQQWDGAADIKAFDFSTTFSCFYRADWTANYTFKGEPRASAVVLYGDTYSDTHAFSVYLDDQVFRADASASGWRVGSTPLFLQTGLQPDKEYVLSVVNYNEQSPNCADDGYKINDFRSCCVAIDALQLLGPRASLISSSSPSMSENFFPSDTTPSGLNTVVAVMSTIIGIVVALLLALVVALMLRRFRRQRRAAALSDPFSSTSSFAPANVTNEVTDGRIRPWVVSSAPQVVRTAVELDLDPDPDHRSHVATSEVSGVAATGLKASAEPRPLATEDMQRVLSFVARRIQANPGVTPDMDTLPTYRSGNEYKG
ncbi:hypothetical protein BKA62DRAFT_760195 [Auriculariales sp. MPI-PUGE-AT-0066]|nr:hypothetical protein BKA62DRAFT_760195 [Auriculariales sp. MPI-PUGE-AT-0066]